MEPEESVEFKRFARLHKLLETKDNRQIRNQSCCDRLAGRNWRLARYVVGEVVG